MFLLFVCCMYEIMEQHPTAFQFKTSFLAFLLDSIVSCRFGTFMFSSHQARRT